MTKTIFAILLCSAMAWGQCARWVPNPHTGKMDCAQPAGNISIGATVVSPTSGVNTTTGYGAPQGTLGTQWYADLGSGQLYLNVGSAWQPVGLPGLPPNGLLAYYDFRPGSDATVLYDRSGNGRNGALASGANAPKWLKRGIACFQSGPTYATFPTASLVAGNNALTVIAAARRPQTLNAYGQIWGYAVSPTLRAAPGVQISNSAPGNMRIVQGGGDNYDLTAPATDFRAKVYVYRYNPTGTAITASADQMMYTGTGTLGGVLAADASSGGKVCAYGNTNTLPFTGSVYALAVWNRVLTDQEVSQVAAYFQHAGNANNMIVFDGNSLTKGTPIEDIYTFPYVAMDSIKAGWEWYNFGVAGQTTTQMSADFDTQVVPLFNSSRSKQILVAWEIGNELGSLTAQQAYDNYKAYCQHARSVLPTGTKIIGINVTPRVTAGFNTKRNAANALLAAEHSFVDALVDVAADASIGCDACYADTTYYQADGIHMTAAGYAIVANLVKTAILAQ